MKITKSNPILSLVNNFLIDSPLPANLTYFWSFGSLLGLNLVIMILTGVLLAMHYTPNTILAFNSVEHIVRDVNNGWLLRYFHANGASWFFIWVYLHIGRGLYYGSYRQPRGLLWSVGVIIFIVMMANKDWPNWLIIKYVNLVDPENILYFVSIMNTIPFSTPKTHAIKRIGPHDYDVIAIIVISLLGDGWMDRIPGKERFSYRFNIDQEDGKNTEYIFWLTKFFYDRGYCKSPKPNKITRIVSNKDRTNSKTRTIYRISLFTHTSFDWIYNSFYVYNTNLGKRIKVIPNWIAYYLYPLTLVNWIMQDGSRQKGQGIFIATNCFTHEECKFLADIIHTKFNLTTSVVSAGSPNQWKISIWKNSMPHLRYLIKDHMMKVFLQNPFIGEMDRKIRLNYESKV